MNKKNELKFYPNELNSTVGVVSNLYPFFTKTPNSYFVNAMIISIIIV